MFRGEHKDSRLRCNGIRRTVSCFQVTANPCMDSAATLHSTPLMFTSMYTVSYYPNTGTIPVR
jgi:hypothetical protein